MGGCHAQPLKVGIGALSTTGLASGCILIGRKIADHMIIISMIFLIGLVKRRCFWPAEVMTRCALSPCASTMFSGATPAKEAFINPCLPGMVN